MFMKIVILFLFNAYTRNELEIGLYLNVVHLYGYFVYCDINN